ncbi:probable LRR receptor-like serine/threonine-protein kinase At1g29720 isoform X2 [Pistacia vera]|nr:probable LRR receptor-like serine/threonine-protein kinase At1g29720 isoform X2 [Pistacia vera]
MYLQEIDLARNYLSGTLPKEWASMQHLTNISLTAKNLSGEIPTDWGYFTNLTFLNIEANQLSGPVPEEFGNLVNLTNLELSSNYFSGRLPIKLAKLKNMKKFRISDNSFTGTVPEFIGGWTNLEMLEMYSSGLEGPIPATIFSLGSLDDLRITDMNGPKFPFPNLTSNLFKKLILRNLNMSGSVHTNNFEVTTTLDLTFNKLEGEINGIRTTPNFMFLSGNMLSGSISETFLDTSKYLDLSFNKFTPLSSCPENSNLNMFRSFYSKNNISGNLSCPRISRCQKYYRSLHINCGGSNVIINNTMYEGDGAEYGATLNFDHGGSNNLLTHEGN